MKYMIILIGLSGHGDAENENIAIYYGTAYYGATF